MKFLEKIQKHTIPSIRKLQTTESYQLLNDFQIIEQLENYNPLVVGTIPIEIDLDDSDVDIILQTNDCNDLEKFLLDKFSHFQNFKMEQRMSDNQNILVCNFIIDQIPFEIYAENKPTHLQYGFLHMMKEFEILNQKGIRFKNEIIQLKKQGYKTEPAFAKLLGLIGNPYDELLRYKT